MKPLILFHIAKQITEPINNTKLFIQKIIWLFVFNSEIYDNENNSANFTLNKFMRTKAIRFCRISFKPDKNYDILSFDITMVRVSPCTIIHEYVSSYILVH